MLQREVNIACVVSCALWVAAILLMGFAWLVWDDQLADHLARTALLTCGIAITASLKIEHAKHQREVRLAFDLGRDSDREREAMRIV